MFTLNSVLTFLTLGKEQKGHLYISYTFSTQLDLKYLINYWLEVFPPSSSELNNSPLKKLRKDLAITKLNFYFFKEIDSIFISIS